MSMDTNSIVQSSILDLPERIVEGYIPRWLVENYDGMERDIQDFFERFFFWENWSGKQDDLQDAKVIAQARAESKFHALMRTNMLKHAANRSLLMQLYEAQKTSWFRYIGGIDDVRQLLEQIYDEATEQDPYGGKRYEISFLLKTLLPTVEALGVPKEHIFSIPQNLDKARRSVAITRRLIIEHAKEPEVLRDKLETELREISDPKISARKYRANVAERMGRAKPETPQPVHGACYLVPGCELIVIESDHAHTQAIEMATRGIVDGLPVRDAIVLLRSLNQRITPRAEKMEMMGIDYIEDEPVVINGKGSLMPSLDSFGFMAMAEVGRQRFMIAQMMQECGHAIVPIYILGTGIKESELEKQVQLYFSFSKTRGMSPHEIASYAFRKVYRRTMLPIELFSMLPDNSNVEIDMLWSSVDKSYGLFLYLETNVASSSKE
jgi:hypothetical protein